MAAPLELDGGAWARFESNVSNSDRPSDRVADGFLGGRIEAVFGDVFDRDWRWQAGLVGEGEAALRFWELGHIEAGPRLGLERKFGLGWQAPRVVADLLFAVRGAGQSGASGLRLAPSLSFVWQAGERWGWSVAYLPEWFFAQRSVFASTGNEVGANGWFDLFPDTRMRLGYAFRHGDVVSYATPPRPDIVGIRISQENTNVFGAERVVYRVVANTHRIETGVVQRLTDHLDLSATYRWEITEGQGLVYENHIVELGLGAAF